MNRRNCVRALGGGMSRFNWSRVQREAQMRRYGTESIDDTEDEESLAKARLWKQPPTSTGTSPVRRGNVRKRRPSASPKLAMTTCPRCHVKVAAKRLAKHL